MKKTKLQSAAILMEIPESFRESWRDLLQQAFPHSQIALIPGQDPNHPGNVNSGIAIIEESQEVFVATTLLQSSDKIQLYIIQRPGKESTELAERVYRFLESRGFVKSE